MDYKKATKILKLNLLYSLKNLEDNYKCLLRLYCGNNNKIK